MKLQRETLRRNYNYIGMNLFNIKYINHTNMNSKTRLILGSLTFKRHSSSL